MSNVDESFSYDCLIDKRFFKTQHWLTGERCKQFYYNRWRNKAE